MKGVANDFCSDISQEYLREIFDLRPDGRFVRIKRCGHAHPGHIAGSVYKNGYRYIAVKSRLYLAHRLVWLYVHGTWPAFDVDHINRNRDDNRIENLREATRSQNNVNSKTQKNNTSGHKGAYYDKRRGVWCAEAWIFGSKKYLGAHQSAESAGNAYKKAIKKHYGEFAEIKSS